MFICSYVHMFICSYVHLLTLWNKLSMSTRRVTRKVTLSLSATLIISYSGAKSVNNLYIYCEHFVKDYIGNFVIVKYFQFFIYHLICFHYLAYTSIICYISSDIFPIFVYLPNNGIIT